MDLNNNFSLHDQLGHATASWMQKIAQSSHEVKQGYAEDHRFLQKGFWYAQDIFSACIETNEKAMIEFLKKNEHLKLSYGYAPPKFFDRIPDDKNPTGYRPMHFLAKKGVLPSEALKACFVGLMIIDCGIACQIARYGALLDILGEEKFNRLFDSKTGQQINIGYKIDDALQPMRYFVDFTQAVRDGKSGQKGHRPVQIGQLVKIDGAANYTLKKPLGVYQAYNAICTDATLGEQKFVAMGTVPSGMSEEQFCKDLVDGYNRDEDPFAIVPDEDKMFLRPMLPDVERLKMDRVNRVKGFDCYATQDFLVDIISDLVKMPLGEISMAFVKNHPSNRNRKFVN